MRPLFVLLCIVVNTSGLIASNDSSFVFYCSLADEITGEPIGFAHVYNESRRFGLIADSSGEFVTNVHIGDTLAFIALGYYGKVYIVSPNDSIGKTIYLAPRYYEIKQVDVSIPRTYPEFKKALLRVDLEEQKVLHDLPEYNPYKTPEMLDTNIINSTGFKIMHPISAIYLKHSKEEKSKRKVWHLQQQELHQGEVDKKYNREIVANTTGLQGDELTNFMGYCSFDFNYLLHSTALEILAEIEIKFQEYTNLKNK